MPAPWCFEHKSKASPSRYPTKTERGRPWNPSCCSMNSLADTDYTSKRIRNRHRYKWVRVKMIGLSLHGVSNPLTLKTWGQSRKIFCLRSLNPLKALKDLDNPKRFQMSWFHLVDWWTDPKWDSHRSVLLFQLQSVRLQQMCQRKLHCGLLRRKQKQVPNYRLLLPSLKGSNLYHQCRPTTHQHWTSTSLGSSPIVIYKSATGCPATINTAPSAKHTFLDPSNALMTWNTSTNHLTSNLVQRVCQMCLTHCAPAGFGAATVPANENSPTWGENHMSSIRSGGFRNCDSLQAKLFEARWTPK